MSLPLNDPVAVVKRSRDPPAIIREAATPKNTKMNLVRLFFLYYFRHSFSCHIGNQLPVPKLINTADLEGGFKINELR